MRPVTVSFYIIVGRACLAILHSRQEASRTEVAGTSPAATREVSSEDFVRRKPLSRRQPNNPSQHRASLAKLDVRFANELLPAHA
jgi:hypothetical protein